MRRLLPFVATAATFLAIGYVVGSGRTSRPQPPPSDSPLGPVEPVDFSRPFVIRPVGRVASRPLLELRPYSVVLDNRRLFVDESVSVPSLPADTAVVVSFDGGRFQVCGVIER